MAVLFFNVIDTSICINIPDDRKTVIRNFLGPFFSEISKSYYTFTVETTDEIRWNKISTFRTDYKYEEKCEGREFRLGTGKFSLDVSLNEKSALLRILSDDKPAAVSSTIISSLKWFLSFIAIDNGGIPFHSSGINNSRESFLFLGRSGSGKSTIYSLFQDEWKKGSDEVNVVIRKNGLFYSFPTPFLSSKGYSEYISETVLTKIYFLVKSAFNKTEIVSNKAELFFSLMENIYTKPVSAYLAEKLMDNIQKLSGSVPCERLYFKNDPSVCSFLDEGEYVHQNQG